jgi:hypothetical protein
MIAMLEPSPPEMLICSLCERPAGRVMTFVPLCLRCRTALCERVASAEPKPFIVRWPAPASDLPALPLGAA